MAITHAFVSSLDDGDDSDQVQPSNWNDEHVIDIFVDNEEPSGTVDGVNDEFTLAVAPSPTTSLQVSINGLIQRPTTDYTISGTTLTLIPAPEETAEIRVSYRKA